MTCQPGIITIAAGAGRARLRRPGGVRAAGWGRAWPETYDTPDALAGEGIEYIADWYNRETGNGK